MLYLAVLEADFVFRGHPKEHLSAVKTYLGTMVQTQRRLYTEDRSRQSFVSG